MRIEQKIASGALVQGRQDGRGPWMTLQQRQAEQRAEAALYLLGFEPSQWHSFRWFMGRGGLPHFDLDAIRGMSPAQRQAEHDRLKQDHLWLKSLP